MYSELHIVRRFLDISCVSWNDLDLLFARFTKFLMLKSREQQGLERNAALIVLELIDLRMLNPKTKRYRGRPIDKTIRNEGLMVLFRKGETVFLVKDMSPFLVQSVRKASRRIKISPIDNPQEADFVLPHHLLKDPINGYWPTEMTL